MSGPIETKISSFAEPRGGMLSIVELASNTGAAFVITFYDKTMLRVEMTLNEGALPGERAINEQYSAKAIEQIAQKLVVTVPEEAS